MASTPTLISVEQYLNSVYRPDCDYIDGEVQERNMGETPHGNLQMFFGWYFLSHRDEWRVDASSEQRIEVAPFRFRIPDVCLISYDAPRELILRTPPVLCLEILSSQDRMTRVQERLDDYARMGVKSIWVVDPWRGTAFAAGPDAVLHEVKDRLTVPGTLIEIDVPSIFAELDRLEKRAAAR